MMRQQQRASTARRGGRDNSRVPMARSDWICSAADVLRCDHARAPARRRAIFRPTRSWATERVGQSSCVKHTHTSLGSRGDAHIIVDKTGT